MVLKNGRIFAKNLSITSGLLFFIAAIIMSTTFIMIAALYFFLSGQADAELEKKVKEYFYYIEKSIEKPLWIYDEETLVKTADNFFRSSPVAGLWIYDNSEKKALYQNTIASKNRLVMYSGNIEYNGSVIGQIRLGLSRDDYFYEINKKIASIIAVIVFVTAALLLSIYLFIQRFLSKPLKEMINGITAVSGGNYDYRFKKFIQKEFLLITNAFHEMSKKIEKREKELKESEEKFKMLADSTSMGIMVYQDNKWIYANPAAMEMSGYSLDELKNMFFWEISDSKFLDLIRERGIKRQKKQFAYSGYEALIKCRNGEKKWAYIEGNSIDYMGKTSGIISVFDITKKKEAENKLVSAWKFVENVINSMPSVIISVDSELVVRLWNKKAEKRTKITAKKAEGLKLTDLFTGLDSEIAKIRNAVLTGSVEKIEKRKALSGSKVIYEDVTIYPVTTKEFKGAVVRIDDVTDRVRLDEALIEAETAKKANMAKSLFLANMSHEIRTPLNGVIGMASIALDSGLEGEQKEYVEIIKTSAENLLSIVSDILDFSKIDSGKIEIANQDFRLEELLVSINDFADEKARAKNLLFESDFDPCLPEHLNGDCDRLKQILINIIDNAVKFTSKGFVRFRAVLENTNNRDVYIKFTVEDSGIGMPMQKLKSLFRPFEQADSSYTREYEGLGLGLAISFQLTKILGGDMRAYSQEKEGSVFEILLPFKKTFCFEDKNIFIPEKNDLPEKNQKKSNILIAEDNLVNQSVFLEFFKNLGYEPEIVPNGKKCLEKLKEKDFDIVFMDCQMPEMDGYEASLRIKNGECQNNKIPVIIALTAHIGEEDRKKCMDYKMDDFISKPVNMKQLKAVLEKWL